MQTCHCGIQTCIHTIAHAAWYQTWSKHTCGNQLKTMQRNSHASPISTVKCLHFILNYLPSQHSRTRTCTHSISRARTRAHTLTHTAPVVELRLVILTGVDAELLTDKTLSSPIPSFPSRPSPNCKLPAPCSVPFGLGHKVD